MWYAFFHNKLDVPRSLVFVVPGFTPVQTIVPALIVFPCVPMEPHVKVPHDILPPVEVPNDAHVRSEALDAKDMFANDVVVVLVSVTVPSTDSTEDVFSVPVGLVVFVFEGS